MTLIYLTILNSVSVTWGREIGNLVFFQIKEHDDICKMLLLTWA